MVLDLQSFKDGYRSIVADGADRDIYIAVLLGGGIKDHAAEFELNPFGPRNERKKPHQKMYICRCQHTVSVRMNESKLHPEASIKPRDEPRHLLTCVLA